MKKKIKSLWIESKQKVAIVGGQPVYDDNSVVIVTFEDDSNYVATFFTYVNL
ncbi:hypothetical protein OCK74_08115 [Chitinophagaceae bacterium LB-8]|uniref:Uncharacterized protein n=1 Tax=Paraflavisolibacter caeni TaxID=2982496 RepID=A0A9X2XV25_9BACT|nr:hypothetical protein [Paraflavisolibacter caeni]MCU7549076.1 hypothetical protein [Paraflavisolibacter caeni]